MANNRTLRLWHNLAHDSLAWLTGARIQWAGGAWATCSQCTLLIPCSWAVQGSQWRPRAVEAPTRQLTATIGAFLFFKL